MSDTFSAEVAVIGGGPAGLVAAIALATAGVDTLLIAPPAEPDHRTTALLAGSVTALETLGVWPACVPHAAPLRKIRLIDATQRLIRAPEVLFAAAEIGLDAFGYNIENRHLVAALEARAVELKLARIAGAAASITPDAAGVSIKHTDGEARVRLVIGADGRRSLCRAAAGIETTQRAYPQTALTLNLAHARPHDDTSTEFHTESGPFTLVPLPGRRSSLVCVLDPAHAAELVAMNDAELAPRDRTPRPFAARHNERRARPRHFPAGDRDARTRLRAIASRWSARRRMWCRRSAPRGSISACATAPPLPNW